MRRSLTIPALCLLLGAALAGAARADQIDPDQSAKVSADVNLSLLTIRPGEYQLTLQNQSALGSIDSFAWVPGPGWTVTAVLDSTPGHCVVNDGGISCTAKIAPPKTCTCQPGGRMTIRFRMTHPPVRQSGLGPGTHQTGTAGGYLVVKTVTMVHRHIPTEVPPPNE
jgi:hypothetical protein